MKIFISLFVALASLDVFAVERDVEIECNLKTAQSTMVKKVILYSATDEIKLQYRDNSSEIVKPVEATREGRFGTENYSSDLVWNNGQVFAPVTAAGPIYIQYACFKTPTISFERCISQGTHEPAQYAGVRMNLNGKALRFFDQNICSRIDRSPL